MLEASLMLAGILSLMSFPVIIILAVSNNRLVKDSDDRLARIEEVSSHTNNIVNSQHASMLRALAVLARRIASDNPCDEAAEQAAVHAEIAADLANK
ncbi:MAG: hypothetical protein ACREC4_02745 [Methylocella sp.]